MYACMYCRYVCSPEGGKGPMPRQCTEVEGHLYIPTSLLAYIHPYMHTYIDLLINLSRYPYTWLPNHPSIYLSMHADPLKVSTYLPIYFMYLLICLSKDRSCYRPINWLNGLCDYFHQDYNATVPDVTSDPASKRKKQERQKKKPKKCRFTCSRVNGFRCVCIHYSCHMVVSRCWPPTIVTTKWVCIGCAKAWLRQ